MPISAATLVTINTRSTFYKSNIWNSSSLKKIHTYIYVYIEVFPLLWTLYPKLWMYDISWRIISQDQIVFPDEAVFEKVFLFFTQRQRFFVDLLTHSLTVFFFFVPIFYRLINHLKEYTFWSSALTVGSSFFGCRLADLSFFYLFLVFNFCDEMISI